MNRTITYTPVGVCSRRIEIDIDSDNIITAVRFEGGCAGNTRGVAALAVGRTVDEVRRVLAGIDCKGRGTSCPDQLARALEGGKVNA